MNTPDQLPNPNRTSGSHISYWLDSVEPIRFNSLSADITTDVVIVGAGIAGLSVGYALAKAGRKVVIVEDGDVGSGETGRTTAHIVNALDDRYYELERVFGKDGARLAAESHAAAISFIEDTAKLENIDCDFKRVSGYLFLDPSDDEESMDKEFEAIKRAGIDAVRHETTPFLKNEQPNCIEFKNQGQFHPMKYMRGLANAYIKYGGQLFTQTHASAIDETGVQTSDGFKISANNIVVATNSPVNNKYVIHLKQYAYRTYVIGAKMKKGSVPVALWWDTGDYEANSEIAPYHYVRTQPYDDQYDLLIIGGEDHPTGLPEAMDRDENSSYSKLEGWAKGRFDFDEVIYRWSGQVMEPMDSLGFIGHNPMDKDNVFIVTGDSGNGITHGTIAGMLIPDLINGRENPWKSIYDPNRLHILKSGKTFAKEFLGGWLQYMKNSPKDADKIRLDDIKPGQAKVIEMEKEKFGAYRDSSNALHVVSATCTHMGCVVRWNDDEKSWDCPCHGSRFAVDGKILNGPAIRDLLYYKE